jgi:hypothetical protein
MKPIDQVRSFLADLIGGPDTPFMVRREQSAQFEAAFVMPAGVRAEAGTLGGVKVEWIVPDGAASAPVLFHLHGGGYVMGTPAGSRAFPTPQPSTMPWPPTARCSQRAFHQSGSPSVVNRRAAD